MVCSEFISALNKKVCNIPTFFPSPRESTVKLCFEALKWVCTPSVLFATLYLWQYVMTKPDLIDDSSPLCSEFSALEYVLSSLILTMEDDINEDYFETAALQLLRQKNSNNLIPEIIMGLHLVREELALNVLTKKDVQRLGDFLYFATSK